MIPNVEIAKKAALISSSETTSLLTPSTRIAVFAEPGTVKTSPPISKTKLPTVAAKISDSNKVSISSPSSVNALVISKPSSSHSVLPGSQTN